jgi:hypothetical protein
LSLYRIKNKSVASRRESGWGVMDTRTLTRSAFFGLVVCIVPQAFGAVGRTAGSANVSDGGEASYSIPLFAPPGTHGMAPRLALVYGHRNASTLLGAGWSIAGLSAITRCQKNWAADGEARAVLNDYSDRFCLDGNKLRLVTGTYGHASATYRTEIETFARITSYGAVGNGPTHFILETRDGIIYEYGNTADSRIESVGQTTARAWALSQIRDQSGNAINFVYAEDTTNGAYRIDSIQYTSNVGQGLTSAYEIDFVWQTKPSNEIDSGYIAGSKVKQITRLDYIDVKYNISTLVRRYELTYESALSSTSKSRLASIQECAGATPDCFAATTFNYQNGTSGLGTEVSMSMNMPTDPWPMDVNGDGRKDLVYSSHITSGSGTWMVMLANSSGGYNAPTNTGVTNTNYTGATPIDYNADGLEDLLVPHSGGTWWVMEGSASGLGPITNIGTPAVFGAGNVRAFDVNGDGRDDLVWAELVGYAGGDSVRYRLRESPGTFSSTVSYLAGPLAADHRIETNVFGSLQNSPQRVPDFNGDGRGDMVIRRTRRQLNPENRSVHIHSLSRRLHHRGRDHQRCGPERCRRTHLWRLQRRRQERSAVSRSGGRPMGSLRHGYRTDDGCQRRRRLGRLGDSRLGRRWVRRRAGRLQWSVVLAALDRREFCRCSQHDVAIGYAPNGYRHRRRRTARPCQPGRHRLALPQARW